jgi:hypothetical protein
VLECAHSVAASLKDVADLDPAFMTTDDKAAALLELATVSAQLDALRLRLMAASGDVAERDAARDVASWLAHRTRADRREARADQRLARSLAHCWHLLADGLTTGAVLTAQAVVIARPWTTCPTTSTRTWSPRPRPTLSRRPPTSAPTSSESWATGSSASSLPRSARSRTAVVSRPRSARRAARPR